MKKAKPMSPEEYKKMRRLIARIGAHALHSQRDSREITAKARYAANQKLNARLLKEIDPNGELSPREREKRLQHARSAHFSQLKLKGMKKRNCR